MEKPSSRVVPDKAYVSVSQGDEVTEENKPTLRSKTSFYHSKNNLPKYLISVSDQRRLKWDIFIVVLALYNCVILPLFLAFQPENLRDWKFQSFSGLVDLVFVFDIVLNFRTTYIDSHTGDEIWDPKAIAKAYLLGKFFIDALAVFPFELLGLFIEAQDTHFTIFGALKLVRILRLGKVVMLLRARESIKLTIKFLQLMLFLILYTHLIACTWFFIVKADSEWVPPTFNIEYPERDFFEESMVMRYSFSLYHALFTLVGIEIQPMGTFQYMVTGFLNLGGALITAVIFGQMSVVMSNLNKGSQKFSELQDQIGTSMTNLNLPDSLQIEIIDFFNSSYSILDRQTDYQKLIGMLPPSLKKKTNKFIFGAMLEANLILAGSKKLRKFAVANLSSAFKQPESEIISQFAEGQEMYFIVNGQCEVQVFDELRKLHRVRILDIGDHFGEIALIYNTQRTALVRTLRYTLLAVLSKDKLFEMMKKFPDIKSVIHNSIASYKDHYKSFTKKLVSRVPYLTNLPSEAFNSLLYSMEIKNYQKNSYLFNENTCAKQAYLILEGKVEIIFPVSDKRLHSFYGKFRKPTKKESIGSSLSLVTQKRSHQVNFAIEELGIGSVVGAKQMLINHPLSIACRAKESTRVMLLTHKNLESIQKISPQTKVEIERCKNSLMMWDNFREEFIPKNLPLDYTKCFKYQQTLNKGVWKAFHKVKSEVVKKVVTHRNRKANKISSVKALVEKIRVILSAEEKGKNEIAKKIAKGEIPPEFIDAADFLDENSISNPILSQFAIQTKRFWEISEFLNYQMEHLNFKVAEISQTTSKLSTRSKDLNRILDNHLTPNI